MAKEKTILMLDKKLFDELLSQGRTGEILAQGGVNLTSEQLKAVKEKAKEQSAEKLMKRKMAVAASPGYQEFMTMPLMSKIFSNLFTNQQPQTAKPEKQVQQAQSQAPEEKESKDKKDPKYSNVPQGKVEKLKLNESEADILASIYNLLAKSYKKDLERNKKKEKYRKELEENETIKNRKSFMALVRDKQKEEKKKKIKSKGYGLGSLLKGGLAAGLAVGGLLAMEKAFAKIAEIDFKDFVPDLSKIFKTDETTTSSTGAGADDYFKKISARESQGKYDTLYGKIGGAKLNGKLVTESSIGEVSAFQSGRKKQGMNDYAAGKYQFMNVKSAAKLAGLSETDLFNPENQEKMMRAYTDENARLLKSEGLPVTPENLSMAHAVGASGTKKLLKAQESGLGGKNALDVLGYEKESQVAKTNPQLNKPVSAVISDLTKEFKPNLALAPQPKIDSNKEADVMREKRNSVNVNSIVEKVATNNVVIIEKPVFVEKKDPVDDVSLALKMLRNQKILD